MLLLSKYKKFLKNRKIKKYRKKFAFVHSELLKEFCKLKEENIRLANSNCLYISNSVRQSSKEKSAGMEMSLFLKEINARSFNAEYYPEGSEILETGKIISIESIQSALNVARKEVYGKKEKEEKENREYTF